MASSFDGHNRTDLDAVRSFADRLISPVEADAQLKLEARSQCGLLPMLTARLKCSGAGKSRDIPPLQTLDETFRAGGFPRLDFHSGNESSAALVVSFWRAMFSLTKPWKVVLLKLVPGCYEIANAVVIKSVVDGAIRTGDSTWVNYLALILLACYQVKLYAAYVYDIEVPGASQRYRFRAMTQRQLMRMQRAGVNVSAGAAASLLSESVRNAVSCWTKVFVCIEHAWTLLLTITFTLAQVGCAGEGSALSVGVSAGSYVLVIALAAAVFLVRSGVRAKLRDQQRDWRLHMVVASTQLLLEEEQLSGSEIKQQVETRFAPSAMCYRMRAFQRYMFDLATDLSIQNIAFLVYFAMLLLIGLSLNGSYTDKPGTYTALLSATKASGDAVSALFKELSSISNTLPYLEHLSTILHFDEANSGDERSHGTDDVKKKTQAEPLQAV